MYDSEVRVNVVFHMDTQFFQVICWKDYLFSHWIVLTPLKKTTGYTNVGPLLFCLAPCNSLFILVPVPYFLVCCSFTVKSWIRLYKFSNLFFFFKIVLTTTDSLHSFINSRISLSNFTKKKKKRLERHCIKSRDDFGEDGHANNTESSNSWTWYIYLFNSLIFFAMFYRCSVYWSCIYSILPLSLQPHDF